MNCFHLAAEKGNPEILKALLVKPFSNQQDKWGKTPLDYAMNSEIREILHSKQTENPKLQEKIINT